MSTGGGVNQADNTTYSASQAMRNLVVGNNNKI